MPASRPTRVGVRNTQASVLAPTGTIGLMMDCDTTGVEPDLGLVKFKTPGRRRHHEHRQPVRAPGAAQPRLRRAPDRRRSSPTSTSTTVDPSARPISPPTTVAVFACSMGDNVIHHLGHVRMMGAVQPFISRRHLQDGQPARVGVRSRRSNSCYIEAWRLGVKAVAIYRDNCKVGQPLPRPSGEGELAPRWRRRRPRSSSRSSRQIVARARSPSACPAIARVSDVRVPGGRLQGLRHRRRVRRRSARRDLRATCPSRGRRSPGSWTPSPSR